MLFKSRKKTKEPVVINLLTIVPLSNIEWRETNVGKIVLLKRKFKSVRLQNLAKRWLNQTHYQIHLDDYGSFVWKMIDGSHSVATIGEELQRKYGDKIEPVYDRLGEFIQKLQRSGFIRIKEVA